MKRIGVITNKEKDSDFTYSRLLVDSIRKHGGQAIIPSELAEALGEDNAVAKIDGLCDALVTVGGDGTFLKASLKAYKNDIPIMGINLGTVGFLTDVEKNDIDHAMSQLIQQEAKIEERMMLEAEITREGQLFYKDYALNDVVVSRGGCTRIMHMEAYADDHLINIYRGDGLIVATPTGSTAYSMSAGGPIVEPESQLLLLTPICSHILYAKSIVIAPHKKIKILVDGNYCNDGVVTLDGQKVYRITGSDEITVRRAERPLKMIKVTPKNFYDILRNKIYDRERA